MLSYSMKGAWGKDIPNTDLLKALKGMGISLEVEPRNDGLSNVKIEIDDKKVLAAGKKKTTARKPKAVIKSSESEKN